MNQRIGLIAIPACGILVAVLACKSNQEEAERKRIREEAQAAVRSDPAMLRLAVSEAICWTIDLEKEALVDIEKEKGHIAGADPAKVLELQKRAAEQRKVRPQLLALLGTVKPFACGSKELEPLGRCVAAGAASWEDLTEREKSRVPPECSSTADRALARLPSTLLTEEQVKLWDEK